MTFNYNKLHKQNTYTNIKYLIFIHQTRQPTTCYSLLTHCKPWKTKVTYKCNKNVDLVISKLTWESESIQASETDTVTYMPSIVDVILLSGLKGE